MSTIAEKLRYLQGPKTAIAEAIAAQGVPVPEGTTFREYAELIGDIENTGSATTTSNFFISTLSPCSDNKLQARVIVEVGG